jgi:hypothetical protein
MGPSAKGGCSNWKDTGSGNLQVKESEIW